MKNNVKNTCKDGKLFIVSAPSGTGKTTLVTTVIKRIQEQQLALERVITYTTKQPRINEQSGIDYHFISLNEFEKKINEGFFIEWSAAYGNYYGCPRHIIDDVKRARSFALIIDRVGAQKIIGQKIAATSIWIQPPDLIVLKQRLVARGAEGTQEIEKRLKLAAQEIEQERTQPFYNYYIINNVFEHAVQELGAIFLQELLK